MLKNYFKIAFRFLWKNKTFSLINIIGLTAGTLCCLYLLLYVGEQYSYDRHHKDADHIYRITSLLKLPGDKTSNMATCSPPIAPAMKNDFSEVKQFTRVVGTIGVSAHLLRFKDKMFYETNALFVDSTFFDVFTYHFIYGAAARAIQEPYSIVIKKATSDKLFGDRNPVGEVVEIDNSYGKHNFKVTGVIDESLGKTHIEGNIFIAMHSGGIGDYVRSNDSWMGNNFTSSYVKLHPFARLGDLEKKFPAFLEKYGAQQAKENGMHKELHLQPIASIHTSPGYQADSDKTVSPSFLRILLLIGCLIQLIACINFMNLSTARASKRAKEVGVRKVAGAQRGNLIWQFLSESILISLIAILLALPLLWWMLPSLNQLTHSSTALRLAGNYQLWLIIAALIIITGLLAGSYPAFYLSAFNTIKVIKGNFTNHISAKGIRKSLVVFQFALSIILIVSILVIQYQLNFIKDKDLGFEKEQRIIITFPTEDAQRNMDVFKNEIEKLGEIKAVSKANNYPSQFVFNDLPVYLKGGNMSSSKNPQMMMVSEKFAGAMGINLLAGRDFRASDSGRVLINETLLNELGLNKQTALGTTLYSQRGDSDHAALQFEIIGIMKDFNYNSLHDKVKPLMLAYDPDPRDLSHLIIAANTKNYKSLIGKLNTAWKNYLSFLPFEYLFLDEQVQKQYESEITLSKLINSFTLMAIIISCLGLFGLSAFTAEQRTKEIGVRKVLGATSIDIAALVSRDFMKLILVAALVAFPIAWWTMNKWLESFAYRINIRWWIFLVAGCMVFFIALVTISFQAIKAALSNPIKSLRTE